MEEIKYPWYLSYKVLPFVILGAGAFLLPPIGWFLGRHNYRKDNYNFVKKAEA
jgi:hypothetical protein